MFKAVIAGYSRSPFTPAKKGKLANVKPDDLLSDVIKNLISKSKVNPEEGKVVIFNSRLLHEIPPNNCNGRYSFVGNLSAV